MTSDEVHTGIIRSNSYIANGNSTVQLLGTTEGSIACFGDTNGISSIAARNRQLEQGAIVTTNSVFLRFGSQTQYRAT